MDILPSWWPPNFRRDPEPGLTVSFEPPIGEWIRVVVRGGLLDGIQPRIPLAAPRLILLCDGEEILHHPLLDASGLAILDRGRPVYVPSSS